MMNISLSKMDCNYYNTPNDIGVMYNLIRSGVRQYMPFNEFQCTFLEAKIDEMIRLGENGFYKDLTIDRAPLRNKYFFGERYSYGSQLHPRGLGNEKLFPSNTVDPIPEWISQYVIRPLEIMGVISQNFVNSVVIVVYQPGGCIAPHVDPPQLFDRPVISVSLFCTSSLSFGSKFLYKPLRASEPFLSLTLPRGIVTLLSGFAANGITHSVRPQDTTERRAVILLRRVHEEAPRMLPSIRTNLNELFSAMLTPENDLESSLNYDKYSFSKAISALCNHNNSKFIESCTSVENSIAGSKMQSLMSDADTSDKIETSDNQKKSFKNETLRNCFFKNNVNFSLDKFLGKN